MSHAPGQVKFTDGAVLHYEYNGTVDQIIPPLYETKKEMVANWRKGDWKKCTCGDVHEDVEVATSYGGGFYWKGVACRKCMCLVSPISTGDDIDWPEEKEGLPEWWKEECE